MARGRCRITLVASYASRCDGDDMNGSNHDHGPRQCETVQPLTPQRAQVLLDSVPARPRRQLGLRDHVSAIATAGLSLASGVLALSGHPWWAVLPAVAAVILGSSWMSGRRQRSNEPRLGPTSLVAAVFGAWLVLPIYRAIRFGETAPFPDLLVLGGLAPAAWLAYYLWLLIRR